MDLRFYNRKWQSEAIHGGEDITPTVYNGSEEPATEALPDPQWDSALFLLRCTNEQLLSHSGVDSMCTSTQWFVEQICSKVAEKVHSRVSQMTSITPEVSEAIQEACNPGDLFEYLTPRHSRESYYKAHFNYVVSSVY